MTRIVKARTVKQRAAAQRYAEAPIARTIPGTGALMPTTSWWLGLTREQLHDRIDEERTRMQFSRFGRVGVGRASEAMLRE
jgi:hypothetical protein